jgi:hypothetical protein
MYGFLYECKFLTIEETNKKKKKKIFSLSRVGMCGFRGEDFLEINQSETRILWQPCLLTDRDRMSNLYRGLSIDTSDQVTVHLAKRFQRRFLGIDQSEIRIACCGHAC